MKVIAQVILLVLIAAAAAAGVRAQSGAAKGAPPAAGDTPAAAAAAADDWKVYTLGAKDSFRIAMPRAPEKEAQTISNDGYNMKATYYNASSGEIFAVVADVYDLPLTADRLPAETQKTFFEKVREGLISGMQAEFKKNGMNPEIKFGTRKTVSLGGLGGFEQDVAIGPIRGRTRMLSKGDHVYIFFVLLLDDEKEEQLARFLDSFEYVGRR